MISNKYISDSQHASYTFFSYVFTNKDNTISETSNQSRSSQLKYDWSEFEIQNRCRLHFRSLKIRTGRILFRGIGLHL